MSDSKYKVGDEVVFHTNTYNSGIRFEVTNVYFHMHDPRNPEFDTYSYRIQNGAIILYKNERDLFWIPPKTTDRPKENG